jgi:hypothetical protein
MIRDQCDPESLERAEAIFDQDIDSAANRMERGIFRG